MFSNRTRHGTDEDTADERSSESLQRPSDPEMPKDHKPQPKAKNMAQNLQALANAFQELANEADIIPNVFGPNPRRFFFG